MLRWIYLSTLLVVVVARPKSQEDEPPVVKESPTHCPESRLSYFITTRVEPLASAVYKADDVDESKCREWCTNNQNPAEKASNCSSYSYNDETRRCKLYAERTYPDGQLERRVTSKPKRLFEKYCMSERLAPKCAKLNYMRVDEMLLSGFAQSTAVFHTLSECMNHCIEEKEFVCKSAMYFYEEGECITNIDTISSNNTLIHVDDDDRVIFIQNNCIIQEDEKTKHTSKETQKESKKTEKTEKPVKTTTRAPETTPKSTTTVKSTTTEQTTTTPQTTTTQAPTTTVKLTHPTIKTTKLVEHAFNDESIEVEEQDERHRVQTEEPMLKGPTAKIPVQEKKINKEVEIGFMNSAEQTQEIEKKEDESKQQLYGAKILAPETEGLLNAQAEEANRQSDFSLPKPSKQAVPEAIKVVKTSNMLNEFKLASPAAGPPSIDLEENRYFSTWSSWTSCSNVGERRIRRRKCLDYKKCHGRLTEIDYCPPELIVQEESIEEQPDNDAFARGPVGPVRQPLPVAKNQGNEEAGSPPSILPPQLPKQKTEVLPDGAPGSPEDIWSPWLGVCQNFVSTQPCKNNQAIGFESRECIAKDPSKCVGPFFRYCTLPC